MSGDWGVLIGVVGTLLGASLTGGFSLLQGRQGSRDKQRDRLEQRWLVHREARRDAYLKLISKLYEFDKLIEELWTSKPNGNHQLLRDVSEVAASLEELATVVKLEGPSSVGDAAQRLVEAASDVYTSLLLVDHDASKQDDNPRLLDLITRNIEEEEEHARASLTAFIEAANAAMGSEVGTPE
ncbi:hypothetical protein [Streptomyces lydicamycinicus]|uniref:hypothetical protein n=1 Tax=Streptomyces lydicamycinicus TaxID=1546107 RepID=UPI003C2DF8E2